MVVLLLAAVCSWLFLRGLIPQLRLRLLDRPNTRSSHRQPTPRGGGLAFVAVSSVASVMALLSGQGQVARGGGAPAGPPRQAVPRAMVR